MIFLKWSENYCLVLKLNIKWVHFESIIKILYFLKYLSQKFITCTRKCKEQKDELVDFVPLRLSTWLWSGLIYINTYSLKMLIVFHSLSFLYIICCLFFFSMKLLKTIVLMWINFCLYLFILVNISDRNWILWTE